MKKLLLSISALFIFSSVSAVDYSSIYLSKSVTEDLRSIESLITVTPLTARIKADEAGAARSYWINPFRNIQRSIRSIEEGPTVPYKTIDRLNRFMDNALVELNTRGTIKVYGHSQRVMGYFLRQDAFYFGAIK